MNTHILIWGDDGLTEKVIEQLATSAVALTVLAEVDGDRVCRAGQRIGADVIVGSLTDPDVIAMLGDPSRFDAFALLVDNDSRVLSAGLRLRQMAPATPMLMRLNVSQIASGITQLTGATVLSATDIAAPVILDLVVDSDDDSMSSWQARKAVTGKYIPRLTGSATRIIIGMFLLTILLCCSMYVYHRTLNMKWIDAMVATAQMCFGDLPVDNAPDSVKLLSVFTLVVGGLSVLLFFSAAHEGIVARMRAQRHASVPKRNHVIVLGGGKAGARTAALLHDLDIPVVVVDRDALCPAASLCSVKNIAFRVGNITDGELLKALHIQSARSVAALTDDDAANIEAALRARSLRDDVRVVVRTFDPEIAERLDQEVAIHRAVSVSGLAAPVFVNTLQAMTAPLPAPSS